VSSTFVSSKWVYIYPYRYMREVGYLMGVSRTVSRKMVSRFDGRMTLIESK